MVRVKSWPEIRATLDGNSALEGLPFMPEMLAYCGRTFRITMRIERVCAEGIPGAVRTFSGRDVVFLDGLRCSGTAHDGCQRGCLLYWDTRWIEPASEFGEPAVPQAAAEPLVTRTGDGKYWCQSTSLKYCAVELSKAARVARCVLEVQAGNMSGAKAVGLVARAGVNKLARKVRGPRPRGSLGKTPSGLENLQPGDIVEVKSLPEIRATLDRNGKNRGLVFTPSMARSAGKRFRVKSRLDRWIDQRTGDMRRLPGTVLLEGSLCEGDFTVGGCPRLEYAYWREVWLRRANAADSTTS